MNLKIRLHTCYSYNYEYLPLSRFSFYQIDFKLNTDLPSKFRIFSAESRSVAQRSVSKENAFNNGKHPPFCKTKGSNTLIGNNFRLLNSEFWIQGNSKIAKCIQLWPLNPYLTRGRCSPHGFLPDSFKIPKNQQINWQNVVGLYVW